MFGGKCSVNVGVHKCYTVNIQLTDLLGKSMGVWTLHMENPTCKASGALIFWIVTVNSVESYEIMMFLSSILSQYINHSLR